LPSAGSVAAAPVAPVSGGVHQEGVLTILLIEDHEDTAEIMAQLIRGIGHHVIVVGRVADALTAMRGRAFDLVISDIGLPDGSGLDFIIAFRERSRAPAVALTGFGTDDDVHRCLAAGFTSHLTKPVNFVQLEQVIQSAMAMKVKQARAGNDV
jgi:CheY-like chemotaxis protein